MAESCPASGVVVSCLPSLPALTQCAARVQADHPSCTLTSEPISVAAGAGRRRRPLGSDDRSEGTLLFDSREDGRGEWKDGRSAGGANCWT